MKRITKRYKNAYGDNAYLTTYDGSESIALIKANQKLGEIEDFEEKIGVPIIDLFNLLGNKIYFFCKCGVGEANIDSIHFYDFHKCAIHLCSEDNQRYPISRLGVDFCMTKEEAYNKAIGLNNEKQSNT